MEKEILVQFRDLRMRRARFFCDRPTARIRLLIYFVNFGMTIKRLRRDVGLVAVSITFTSEIETLDVQAAPTRLPIFVFQAKHRLCPQNGWK